MCASCLWHSYCFPSTSWCPSSVFLFISFQKPPTDSSMHVSLSLCVHWKSQVVKFYRKFDHLTLTLAQNVREETDEKEATLSKPTVPSKALRRYTQWASQSHDKTFLEFIVESRASSLNEFLTLRISGPKTSDSFSIASLSLSHSLLSLGADRCLKCEKHLPFSWLILFLRPFLIHHTTSSFFSSIATCVLYPFFLSLLPLLLCSSHSIPITKCIDSRFPCTISFIIQLSLTHTHIRIYIDCLHFFCWCVFPVFFCSLLHLLLLQPLCECP